MRHFKLRQFQKVWFLHLEAPKAAVPWQFGDVVSQFQKSPEVCNQSTPESASWTVFWAEFGLFCRLHLFTVVGLEQHNQTVHFCHSASVEMSYSIRVRIWRGQLGNLTTLSVYWSVTVSLGLEMGLQPRLDLAVNKCNNGCVSSLQKGWEAGNTFFFFGWGEYNAGYICSGYIWIF